MSEKVTIRGMPGRKFGGDYPAHLRYVGDVIQFEDADGLLIGFIEGPLTENQENQIASLIRAGAGHGGAERAAQIRRLLSIP